MNAKLLGALCVSALALGMMSPAAAQGYPDRSVRVIVPQSPGGTTDVLARALVERLSKRWGHPVVVENIGGAAGSAGTQRAATSKPDGYTLLLASEGVQAINPHLYSNQLYDVVKDFRYIAPIASSGFYLIVTPNLPAKNLKEFIALARKNPDAINYGTTGVGSINHLVGEMMKMEGKFNMVHVPHKAIAQVNTAIAGGHLESAIASIASVVGQVQSGSVRALAVTSEKRSSLTPDVPTVSEAGLDGFNVAIWWGLLAPAGTDEAIITKVNADVNDVLRQKEFQDLLASVGAEALIMTPDEFTKLHARSLEKWGQLVKKTGAKFE